MRDAVKTLYDHWINIHEPSAKELIAFKKINEVTGRQAEKEPLQTAITEYSNVIQYEAFREGVLTALSLLHPLPEQGDM